MFYGLRNPVERAPDFSIIFMSSLAAPGMTIIYFTPYGQKLIYFFFSSILASICDALFLISLTLSNLAKCSISEREDNL